MLVVLHSITYKEVVSTSTVSHSLKTKVFSRGCKKMYQIFGPLFLIVVQFRASEAIGEGVLDFNALAGMFRGFGDIFQEVNTTDVTTDGLMGKWHQMYKAAINFDAYKSQIYCPVEYFTRNLVMGPDGFSMDEAYHIISKNGPIETYKRDINKVGPGKFWVYTEQYFYPHQMYVLKAGPELNGTYQYFIATDQNRLSLNIFARNPQDFYKLYDAEVSEAMKQEGFGGDSFWNQPVAIYHGTDCYYPGPKEVFARRVLRDQQVNLQQGQPFNSPLRLFQGLVNDITQQQQTAG